MTNDAGHVSPREIWGWGLYDFANSPFATTILAVIFNRYFAEALAGGEEGVVINLLGTAVRVPGVTFFTYTLAAAMLIVAVIAPVLGAIADASGSKKKFLAFFCYLGVGATAMLYFVNDGQYWRGALFFIVAQVGFAAANVFYNAFLPEISTPKNIGWISGFGFTLGYISGAAVLAINLAMLQYPQWLGFSAPFTPQDTFLSVAVWWGVFSIPTFLWLRERQPATALPAGISHVRYGIARVGKTFRNLRQYRELTKFLVAFLI
jgi:UMF1 family MFS transporter